MEPVLAIVGPTATGKSRLAVFLAERLDGEIVSADALQAYRGLDIGTAKPSAATRRRVPHHLLDVLDPEEAFSAGEFAARARQAVAAIQRRGRRVILAGGSGLYLRALLAGMAKLPPADAAVRAELAARLVAEGLPSLRRELAAVDPETARRLAPADAQRTLRALEVFHLTGRPLAGWIAEQPFGRQGLPAIRLGLTLPRAVLYDRIADRVREMIAAGWVEEVRGLRAAGVSHSAPAFQAIGYRQLLAYLAGQVSLDAAVDATIRATRRYAKRQQTWFRGETDITWFTGGDRAELLPVILEVLARRGWGRGS